MSTMSRRCQSGLSCIIHHPTRVPKVLSTWGTLVVIYTSEPFDVDIWK
jgi:hypothetical protein